MSKNSKLIPRLSTHSPVHHANLNAQVWDPLRKKEDLPLTPRDSLDSDSEGLTQEVGARRAGEDPGRSGGMEPDSLDEGPSERDSSSDAEEAAGRGSERPAGDGAAGDSQQVEDKYSDLRYDPNWKKKREEGRVFAEDAAPGSADSSADRPPAGPLYPSKEPSLELPGGRGARGGPPSPASLLGSEFLSPDYEPGPRGRPFSELSGPEEASRQLAGPPRAPAWHGQALLPRPRDPRRRKARHYFVEKNKLTLGFPSPKTDSYLQLHNRKRGDPHLQQVASPARVTGRTPAQNAKARDDAAFDPEDQWHQRAQQLKNYQEHWSQYEDTKSSNGPRGESSETTNGPQPSRRAARPSLRKQQKRQTGLGALGTGGPGSGGSQDALPSQPQPLHGPAELPRASRGNPRASGALGGPSPKDTCSAPAPPKQALSKGVQKDAAGHHAVQSAPREGRRAEGNRPHQQLPGYTSEAGLSSPRGPWQVQAQVQPQPGGRRGPRPASDRGCAQRGDKPEAKYRNLEILWRFHASPDVDAEPAGASPDSRLSQVMGLHQQALVQLAEVQPGEAPAGLALPPIRPRLESEAPQRSRRPPLRIGRSGSEGYLLQLEKGKRHRRRSGAKSSKIKGYQKRDVKLGGLGPDLESIRDKMQALMQQKEYARHVQEYNAKSLSALSKPQTAKPEQKPAAPRQKALEYAKTIPKPRPSNANATERASKGKHKPASGGTEPSLPGIPLLETLRRRHERERQAVAAFKLLHLV